MARSIKLMLVLVTGLFLVLAARSVKANQVQTTFTRGDDPVIPASEFNMFNLITPVREAQKMFQSEVGSKELVYFSPGEFYGWFDQMSPELLRKLDIFRDLWGAPVVVSSHKNAIGRHLGPTDTSQHNIDKWGEVRAIDVFPQGLNSVSAKRAFDLAKAAGFSGIGLYNDTNPGWMMHLDVRSHRTSANPAKWARNQGKWVGIQELIA